MLYEVDVHEHHDKIMNEHVLDIGIIDNNTQKSLAASITQFPGVDIISNGTDIGIPVIHGLTGNRMTIINNGVLHMGQQWGIDHSPEIDLNSRKYNNCQWRCCHSLSWNPYGRNSSSCTKRNTI